jgi:uncharacterized protein (DUF433 family)
MSDIEREDALTYGKNVRRYVERLERELAEAKAVIDATKVKLAELLPELDKISHNAAIEEAAKVAEHFPALTHGSLATAPAYAAEQAADEIAAAIRALVKP